MMQKSIKKKLIFYCEGATEQKYFETLQRNDCMKKYKIETRFYDTSLINTLEEATRVRKEEVVRIGTEVDYYFVFDADKLIRGDYKSDNELVKNNKDQIYLSNKNFDFFIKKFHKEENNKNNFPSELNKKIINLEIKTPNDSKNHNIKQEIKYKKFKTVVDLLENIF